MLEVPTAVINVWIASVLVRPAPMVYVPQNYAMNCSCRCCRRVRVPVGVRARLSADRGWTLILRDGDRGAWTGRNRPLLLVWLACAREPGSLSVEDRGRGEAVGGHDVRDRGEQLAVLALLPGTAAGRGGFDVPSSPP